MEFSCLPAVNKHVPSRRRDSAMLKKDQIARAADNFGEQQIR